MRKHLSMEKDAPVPRVVERGRTHSLPTNPGRIASPVYPHLIYDRHTGSASIDNRVAPMLFCLLDGPTEEDSPYNGRRSWPGARPRWAAGSIAAGSTAGRFIGDRSLMRTLLWNVPKSISLVGGTIDLRQVRRLQQGARQSQRLVSLGPHIASGVLFSGSPFDHIW